MACQECDPYHRVRRMDTTQTQYIRLHKEGTPDAADAEPAWEKEAAIKAPLSASGPLYQSERRRY